MKIIPAKTPDLLKSLFPNFVWNVQTEKKELFLTFDDGPTPEITDWVLDQLRHYNAKGTFFCIGNNIEKYPEIFQRIISDGHNIGNHTHHHLKGWKTKTEAYIDDIAKAANSIGKLYPIKNKEQTLLFRPPYGKFKSKQSKSIQKKGYKIILWDVLSFDWDNDTSEEACLQNVLSATKEGSIIVFHDSVKAQHNLKYALPRVLQHYSEKGFDFKSIAFEN